MALVINGIDVSAITGIAPVTVRGVTVQFLPYSRPTASSLIGRGGETAEGQRIRRLREAIHHINSRIRHHAAANRYFKRIPAVSGASAQSLDALLSGPDILICLDPTLTGPPLAAATPIGQRRISITAFGFSGSGRSVEATIIHELAHVNGASNTTRDAEDALRHSRMGDQFDPSAVG